MPTWIWILDNASNLRMKFKNTRKNLSAWTTMANVGFEEHDLMLSGET